METKAKKQRRGQGEWCFTECKRGNNIIWTARKQFGYKENGKQNIKAFYGKSITEVKQKAREYEKTLIVNSPVKIQKDTLYEYMLNWLKTYKVAEVRGNTYDAIEYCIESRVKPYDISRIQMCNLTTEVLQKYINEITNNEKKYSHATIKKTYDTINNCLTHAVGLGDLVKNPMDFVKMPSKDNVQTQEKTIEFFDQEDIDKLFIEAQKKYRNGELVYSNGYIIILIMYTGMRIGECLGLTWGDVDFENKRITIDNTITVVKEHTTNKRVIKDGSPKTKKVLERFTYHKRLCLH